jgi:hypothetical protein
MPARRRQNGRAERAEREVVLPLRNAARVASHAEHEYREVSLSPSSP